MTTQVRLPELSETEQTGTVGAILVSVGDEVVKGQALIEIETEKAAVEVPSTEAGKVTEIHVQSGQEISVGHPIVTLEAVASEAQGEAQAEDASENGARTERAEPPAEPYAPASDGRKALPVKDPEPKTGDAAPGPPAVPGSVLQADLAGSDSDEPVPAAPSVRRFAREIGIDIREVAGTGPGGRISVEDVKAHARRRNAAAAGTVVGVPAPQPGTGWGLPTRPLPDFEKWGPVERRSMSSVRKTIARRVAYNWITVPHVTQFEKADITELEAFRKRHAPRVEAAGGKLTMTAILTRVVAEALKVFPKFAASVDAQRQEIVYRKYAHIGIAVDTEYGLLIPVIRDVDKKSLTQISVELTEISEKARRRKLSMEEMEGAVISISNLGGYGGTNFTPIVNEPEVSILAVSRARVEPVYQDGEFKPRLMLPLGVSYDHRLIDGADGLRFLRWVCDALENPFVMFLER